MIGSFYNFLLSTSPPSLRYFNCILTGSNRGCPSYYPHLAVTHSLISYTVTLLIQAGAHDFPRLHLVTSLTATHCGLPSLNSLLSFVGNSFYLASSALRRDVWRLTERLIIYFKCYSFLLINGSTLPHHITRYPFSPLLGLII